MSEADPHAELKAEAQALIESLLAQDVDEAGLRRLDALVCRYDDIASMYVHYMHQESVMAAHESAAATSWPLPQNTVPRSEQQILRETDALILPAIRIPEGERLEPLVVMPPAAPTSVVPARRLKLGRLAPLVGVAAAILIVATAMTPRLLQRSAPSVAVIDRAVDVQWGAAAPALKPGSPLPATELSLKSGVVQLFMASGARVVVEAPARFSAKDRGEITLLQGRLTAEAPPAARGFTVRTPTATAVDLGTEFGVSVGSDGTTEVHVFLGTVKTAPNSDPGASPTLLKAGEAASVSQAGLQLIASGAAPQNFVHGLSNLAVLDLADVIAGGDGTTHRRGVGIDVMTGAITSDIDASPRTGDGQYHSLPSLPALDGGFIPDDRAGPVRIDSAGHTFSFPGTAGESFSRIWVGGPVPWTPGEPFVTTLGGTDYSADGHGLILLHANKGVTIDLDALRRLHPGLEPARFRSIVGNTLPQHGSNYNYMPHSNIYVIVDGKLELSRLNFTNRDQPWLVDLRLAEGARFLTLVTTHADVGTRGDWIIWGDPQLEMLPALSH